jgi:hypothetical protein
MIEPGSLIAGCILAPIAGLHELGSYSAGLVKGLVTLLVARPVARLAGVPARTPQCRTAGPASGTTGVRS